MKRLAVIDLGSNTARLIVVGYSPRHSFRLLDELRQVVRLSEGMGQGKVIRAEAFARGIDTLRTFRAYCDAAGITDICATATSAVRDAANGKSFVAAAKERAGLELTILSGEREAYYGALAVANSLTIGGPSDGTSGSGFVLDVGGGSAQLSRLRSREFAGARSWPLGAVRLSEAFILSDPPKKKEVKALLKHVGATVGVGLEGFGEGSPLVGMGGTIRNLATVQQKRDGYPLDLVHGYALGREALARLVDDLIGMTLAERRGVPGLNTDRADIIVAGAIVVRELLERSGAGALTVSGQGLREGLFYPYLLGEPYLLDGVRRFSVENVARQYYDRPEHNAHVQKLSLTLFDQLAPLHGYGAFERELLAAAAKVHDVGMAVNYYDHHKHGFYLLMSAALPGYSHREQGLIALLTRYHRKGKPEAQGLESLLEEGDMKRVGKLAALLRLAEYLERGKAQRVEGLRCHLGDGFVQIEALASADARVEVSEANRRSDLFTLAYGVQVEVVPGHEQDR